MKCVEWKWGLNDVKNYRDTKYNVHDWAILVMRTILETISLSSHEMFPQHEMFPIIARDLNTRKFILRKRYDTGKGINDWKPLSAMIIVNSIAIGIVLEPNEKHAGMI